MGTALLSKAPVAIATGCGEGLRLALRQNLGVKPPATLRIASFAGSLNSVIPAQAGI